MVIFIRRERVDLTGKTHKAIGVATGVAMVIYSVGVGEPIYALGILTAPVGAMLPDIDHNSSKLGSARKAAIDKLKVVMSVMSAISFLLCLLVIGLSGNLNLAGVFFSVALVCLLTVITSSERILNHFPFLKKHRGIMHTLVVPVVMSIGFLTTEYSVVAALLAGCILGYVSHIVADCLTKMGCPIAFPLSKECISLLPVKTGTALEYIVACILCVCINLFAVIAVNDSDSAEMYIIVFGLFIVGIGIAKLVASILKKFASRQHKKANAFGMLVFGLATLALAVLVGQGMVEYCLIAVALGWTAEIVKQIIGK